MALFDIDDLGESLDEQAEGPSGGDDLEGDVTSVEREDVGLKSRGTFGHHRIPPSREPWGTHEYYAALVGLFNHDVATTRFWNPPGGGPPLLAAQPWQRCTGDWQPDQFHGGHLVVVSQVVEGFVGGRRIQVEYCQGFTAGLISLATQRQVGDVDLVLAQHGTDVPDQSGHVVVPDDQQVAVEIGVQLEAVQLDQSQETVSEDGGRGGMSAGIGGQRGADQRGEVARFGRA